MNDEHVPCAPCLAFCDKCRARVCSRRALCSRESRSEPLVAESGHSKSATRNTRGQQLQQCRGKRARRRERAASEREPDAACAPRPGGGVEGTQLLIGLHHDDELELSSPRRWRDWQHGSSSCSLSRRLTRTWRRRFMHATAFRRHEWPSAAAPIRSSSAPTWSR